MPSHPVIFCRKQDQEAVSEKKCVILLKPEQKNLTIHHEQKDHHHKHLVFHVFLCLNKQCYNKKLY